MPITADVHAGKVDTYTPIECSDRRERKRLCTIAAIRKAALELVAERGLEQVSVAMIAERADIGYRTFFNHFSSKEEALIGPDPVVIARVVDAFERRPSTESPLEALLAAFVDGLGDFEAKRADVCLRLSVMDNNPELRRGWHAQYDEIERQLAQAVARRTGTNADTDLYPNLLAATATSALRICMLRWRASGAVGSPIPKLRAAYRMLGAGFATESRQVGPS